MYEKFTDRARKVMQLANREAKRFTHEYIGSEHILLGLVAEGTGVAANVLKNVDIDLAKIRIELEKIVPPGPDDMTIGKLPLTPRAKKVIEFAIYEARSLEQNYIGTEHLLLGLLREHETVAAQVLMNLGADFGQIRREIVNLLGLTDVQPSPAASAAEPLPATIQDWPGELKAAAHVLDERIARLARDKQTAVAECDFVRAASLRDEARTLQRRRNDLLHEWALAHPAAAFCRWNGGSIVKQARRIEAERCWHELVLLADELEAAGCSDPEVLYHCRHAGEHADRCWVVDWLLLKL